MLGLQDLLCTFRSAGPSAAESLDSSLESECTSAKKRYADPRAAHQKAFSILSDSSYFNCLCLRHSPLKGPHHTEC